MKFQQVLSNFGAICSGVNRVLHVSKFARNRVKVKVERIPVASEGGSVRLPQEIVDYIVEHISNDRSTLFACTHLSRTWCIAARPHLHRTFTVSDSAGFKAIKVLQRVGVIDLVRRVAVTRGIDQSDFLGPKALTGLNAFASLQELDLRYLDLGELVPRLHEGCDALRSAIRTLTLHYPTYNANHIFFFVNLFANLENLAVEGIDSVVTGDSQVPAIELSPPLTGQLRLSRILDRNFIRYLGSMQKGVKFRTVDLRFCQGMREIIDGCAGTMERLIWYDFDSRDIMNLSFSQFTSLRHVEVWFKCVVRVFPDNPFYEFVSTISSSQLETCLTLSHNSDLDELRRTLLKPEGESPTRNTGARPGRNVKVTLGLEIMKDGVEARRSSIAAALDRAIKNGVFNFLNGVPNIEVYHCVWN